MKLWLLGHGALWAMRVGDFLSRPFFRLERRLTDVWFTAAKGQR